jgi:osmotically-inducible protein OsmY
MIPSLIKRSAIILLLLFVNTACSNFVAATRSDPIPEDYGKRSLGRMIDDSLIETKTSVNLKKTDQQLKDAHLNITSYNGIVLLVGQVPSQDLRELAGEVTSKVRNVRKVHNELAIAGPISIPARTNDSWLTTKVKSKLLASKQVEGRRVKVVTENGIVYLMGLVSRDEADAIVDIVRSTFGVQKIVRIFEYIGS